MCICLQVFNMSKLVGQLKFNLAKEIELKYIKYSHALSNFDSQNPSFISRPLFNVTRLKITSKIMCYFINACYTFWVLLNMVIPKKI